MYTKWLLIKLCDKKVNVCLLEYAHIAFPGHTQEWKKPTTWVFMLYTFNIYLFLKDIFFLWLLECFTPPKTWVSYDVPWCPLVYEVSQHVPICLKDHVSMCWRVHVSSSQVLTLLLSKKTGLWENPSYLTFASVPCWQTSLLRRLQAQTLPNATPPIGKIYPFSKMAVIFEPVMQFSCPSGFKKFFITINKFIL